MAFDGFNVIDWGRKGAVDWLCFPLNSALFLFMRIISVLFEH